MKRIAIACLGCLLLGLTARAQSLNTGSSLQVKQPTAPNTANWGQLGNTTAGNGESDVSSQTMKDHASSNQSWLLQNTSTLGSGLNLQWSWSNHTSTEPWGVYLTDVGVAGSNEQSLGFNFLNQGTFATHTDWTSTGSWGFGVNMATWTAGSGDGDLGQSFANTARVMSPFRYYQLTYTTTNSNVGINSCVLYGQHLLGYGATDGSATFSLQMNNGTHVVYFMPNGGPGSTGAAFDIHCIDVAGQHFNLTLVQVNQFDPNGGQAVSNLAMDGFLLLGNEDFASLGAGGSTPAPSFAIWNGALNTQTSAQIYCWNCDTPVAPGAICTSSGDQKGAMAFRIQGDWECFAGEGGSVGGSIATPQVAFGTGANTIGGSANITTALAPGGTGGILNLQATSAIGTVTFTGAGLNDMTVTGPYTGFASCTYTITIATTGTPDKFNWNDGACNNSETGVNVVASYSISNGLTLNFAATTGHTAGNHWDFAPTVTNTMVLNDASSSGAVALFHGNGVGFQPIPFLINDYNGFSTYLGENAGNYSSGSFNQGLNTAVGNGAMSSQTVAGGDSAFGKNSLLGVTIGQDDSALGFESASNLTTGNNNTCIGDSCGSALTTGSGNTMLGQASNVSSGSATNQTALGFGATSTCDNCVQLGNSSVTTVSTAGTYAAGALSASSLVQTDASTPRNLVSSNVLPNGTTATTQAGGDATTKVATDAFVNNALAGINPAVAVQAATTSAANTSSFTYFNGVGGIGATLTGPNNIGLTVDGFAFNTLGQRLLVKNDTQSPSGAFNGVYYVTVLPATLQGLVLTRALDFDQPSDINNTGAIPVVNGTVNGSTSWVVTSAVNTVGTDPITFTKFTLNPSIIAIGPGSSTAGDLATWASTDGVTLADGGAVPTAVTSKSPAPPGQLKCKDCQTGGNNTTAGGIIGGIINNSISSSQRYVPWFNTATTTQFLLGPLNGFFAGPINVCAEGSTPQGALGNFAWKGEDSLGGAIANEYSSILNILPGSAAGCFAQNPPTYTQVAPLGMLALATGTAVGSTPTVSTWSAGVYGSNEQPMGANTSNGTVAGSSTAYTGWQANGFNTTEGQAVTVIPYAGTLSGLSAKTASSQPTGAMTLAPRKNNTTDMTATTITSGGAAGIYTDSTETDTFAAGDYVEIKAVNASVSTSAQVNEVNWYYTPTASNGPTAIVQFYIASNGIVSNPIFIEPYGLSLANIVTEASAEGSIPYAATLKNLYCYAKVAPTTTNATITVEKNGADSTITGTFSTGATVPGVVTIDTTHSVSFAAQDRISLKVAAPGTWSGSAFLSCSLEVDAS